MKDMGYTKESLKAAGKTMTKEAFSNLNKELGGRMYEKVGQYMNKMEKAAYFLEKDGTYPISDVLANKGVNIYLSELLLNVDILQNGSVKPVDQPT